MNLGLVPRIVGNPSQRLVTTKRELVDFIKWNNEHAPVFVAHNAYPSYTQHVIPEPLSVLYECTPFDFDAEDLEIPKEDAIKLANAAEEKGLDVRIRFSGSKGYHVYLAWKPITIAVRKDEQKRKLKDIIRAVHIHFIRELDLQSMDGRIISDYRRLMRVPNTRHGREERTKAGPKVTMSELYCVSLTPDELRSLSTQEVLNLAKSPRKQSFAPVHGKISILDYIRSEGLDLEAYKGIQGSLSGTYAKPREVPNKLVEQYVRKVCIQMDLFSRDPAHLSRFALATYLAKLGFPKDYTVAFIKQIAEQAGWVDRYNQGVTEYQVSQIMGKGYNPPTCTRLKQEGLCIGPDCPIFFNSD